MGNTMNQKNSPPLPESVLEALVEKARLAAQHSYSPYSEFKVGAALLLTNGEVVAGTNVENISFGTDHLRGAVGFGQRGFPIRTGDSD